MDNNYNNNLQNPFSTGICIGNVQDSLLGKISANSQGLPPSPYSTYAVTPLTAQPDNVALVQSVTAFTTLVLTPGTGVTLVTDPTSPYVGCLKLDCPRALQIVVDVSSGSSLAANVIVDGYAGFPGYERRTQCQVNTPATAEPIQIVTTLKTFRYIKSITVSGGVGTGGTVSVGTADILGLPFFVEDIQDIIATRQLVISDSSTRVALSGSDASPSTITPSGIPATTDLRTASITLTRFNVDGTPGPFFISAGTATTFSLTCTNGDYSLVQATVAFGQNCQITKGDTTTPSLLTGDPIGTVLLATPSDGTTPLRVYQYLKQVDISPQAQTITGYLGLPPYNNLG